MCRRAVRKIRTAHCLFPIFYIPHSHSASSKITIHSGLRFFSSSSISASVSLPFSSTNTLSSSFNPYNGVRSVILFAVTDRYSSSVIYIMNYSIFNFPFSTKKAIQKITFQFHSTIYSVQFVIVLLFCKHPHAVFLLFPLLLFNSHFIYTICTVFFEYICPAVTIIILVFFYRLCYNINDVRCNLPADYCQAQQQC